MTMRPPPAGPDLAGYRVEQLLGRGGMGEVHRALDVRLGRPVALKLLAPTLGDDERLRERLLRESRLAAGLDHPNVIPIYEAGEDDGRLFMILRDETSGSTTYGAGRFLVADKPVDGRTTVDFNKAYNPPCVFTPYATCTLPWPANRLPIRIEAGERTYGEH